LPYTLACTVKSKPSPTSLLMTKREEGEEKDVCLLPVLGCLATYVGCVPCVLVCLGWGVVSTPPHYINSSRGFPLTHVLAYAAQALPRSTSPRPASEAILNLSCACFRTTLPPQTPSMQPSNACIAPSTLSSNATLFFVIGTFAALKKPIVYANGAQIGLGTRWCVFIVPFLVGGGGGGRGEAQCGEGHPAAQFRQWPMARSRERC
jgi:hypothetical protein